MEGEEWNGTGCAECPAEHYKDVIGNNVTCEACPLNETAPAEGYAKCGKLNSWISKSKNKFEFFLQIYVLKKLSSGLCIFNDWSYEAQCQLFTPPKYVDFYTRI